MIKLTTYINHDSFLEFNFNDCEINYIPTKKWVQILSTKQKLNIQNNFIAAQDEAVGTSIYANSLAKMWIQDLYKKGDKILIITSPQDEPIRLFWGKELSIVDAQDNFYQFKVDDKFIWTFGMKFMVLTHRDPA